MYCAASRVAVASYQIISFPRPCRFANMGKCRGDARGGRGGARGGRGRGRTRAPILKPRVPWEFVMEGPRHVVEDTAKSTVCSYTGSRVLIRTSF